MEKGSGEWAPGTPPGKGKKGWKIRGGLWVVDTPAGGELRGGDLLEVELEASETGLSVTLISGLPGFSGS